MRRSGPVRLSNGTIRAESQEGDFIEFIEVLPRSAADAAEAGSAWSDIQIAEVLDTGIDTVARTRQQLVDAGIDAALTRKHSPNSARGRIFDGAAERDRARPASAACHCAAP